MPAINIFSRATRTGLAAALAVTLGAFSAGEADAKKRRASSNPKFAAYVIDARTGKVLHSRYANAPRYPASLTKMMTLYLAFEELKARRMTLKTRIRMSREANKRPPSKIYIKTGRSISAEQAIYALVTKSANNVAAAFGEHMAGSESAFARRMTLKARQLGMMRTTFRNASGLPNASQKTTAADMAKLGLALRQHFPKRYRYFQTRSFRYGKRSYPNHNRLLGRVKGVDGIKTGYTRASGFNLVTSASSRGRRIVAVVMGGRSGRTRNAAMTKLVRKYLPRASRRGGKRLIAAWRPSWGSSKRVLVAATPSNRKIELPTPRPPQTIEDVVEASAPAAAAPSVSDATKTAKAMVRKPAAKRAMKKGAWSIQVGASRTRKGARQPARHGQAEGPRHAEPARRPHLRGTQPGPRDVPGPVQRLRDERQGAPRLPHAQAPPRPLPRHQGLGHRQPGRALPARPTHQSRVTGSLKNDRATERPSPR